MAKERTVSQKQAMAVVAYRSNHLWLIIGRDLYPGFRFGDTVLQTYYNYHMNAIRLMPRGDPTKKKVLINGRAFWLCYYGLGEFACLLVRWS